jgi:hypothetical protein
MPRWLNLAIVAMPLLAVAVPIEAQQASRVALVVGNSSYRAGLLKNPVTDAFDIAQALRDLGFEVLYRQDLTREQFLTAISTFGNHTSRDSEIVFYYSGHAFQLNGINYLAPVDLKVNSSESPDDTAVRLDRVLAAVSGSVGAKIVILDACRTNPFSRPSAVVGLAKPQEVPKNTLVSFSTAPNSLASDGTGSHSPYTRALLRLVRRPGVLAHETFKEVRTIVDTSTEGRQIPWEESSLEVPFYFRAPIFIVAQFSGADDDAMIVVDSKAFASWGNDHGGVREISLHAGDNPFVIRVFNQRSYTGGIPGLGGHLPEGWNYAITLKTRDNHLLSSFSDSENQPADNGPRHGKWFTVVQGNLQIDDQTGAIHLADVDPHVWTH